MFYYKIRKSRGKTLLAACDSGLLGKKFEEGKLALRMSGDFSESRHYKYHGKKDSVIGAERQMVFERGNHKDKRCSARADIFPANALK